MVLNRARTISRAAAPGGASPGRSAGRRRPAPRPAPAAPTLASLLALLALASLSLLAAAAGSPAAAEAPPPRSAEVSLPLEEYLALADGAARAEEARQAAQLRREPPSAEVVTQRTLVEIGTLGPLRAAAGTAGEATAADSLAGSEARLTTEIEVLVLGHPQAPLALPLAGVAVAVGVESPAGAAATVGGGGAAEPGLYLVAGMPGRYKVRAESRARLAGARGESRVTLPRIVAPVAALDVDLPAEVAWECPGAVLVDDRAAGGRPHQRLSAGRGHEPGRARRRRVLGDEASALRVQDDVVTLLELRPEGLRRHDVVLYEVSGGALGDLAVDLPAGFEVERAGTDEGEVQPIVAGNHLVVHRQHGLRGSGYLVLTTRPAAAAGSLAVGLVAPTPPARARYLAVAATVPGGMEPQPAASWARVDLDDLPRALAGALAELDVTTAWRLREEAAAPGLAVRVTTAPQAAALETVVRRRLTTTLLTVDGTLLHQDRLELAQAGESLSLALPAGATLWSAAVDGERVRPLVRGASGAELAVPLGEGGARVVEVVAVLEKAVPTNRARLAFELARVEAPVLEHRWRLLLPESARYRFRAGDLRPAVVPASRPASRQAVSGSGAPAGAPRAAEQPVTAPAARDPWQLLQANPGVLTDRINVGGHDSGQQSVYSGPLPPGLRGRVADQTGAALPGATVTITTAAQLPPQVQVTNAAGEFAFPSLPPGTYKLQAELRGFAPLAYPGIRLATREHGAYVEVTLNAVVEDAITATSETPLLDEKAIRDGVPAAALHDLRQGLVEGIRPLPVAVPETGKSLLLAGVLPPARVAVELEVKPAGK